MYTLKPHPTRKALAVVLVLTLSLAGLGLLSPSASAGQPKIRWSENQLAVEVSPGGGSIRQLTFTSDHNIQNVRIEAVPEIAGLVNVQTSQIASVFADQPQTVTLFFSAPADAAPGVREGTIHVRAGSRTLPQTLKVSIDVKKGVIIVPEGDADDLASPATVSLSGASETAFNPRSCTLRFNVSGAPLAANPSAVEIFVNGFRAPAGSFQLTSSSVSLPLVLAEGRNEVAFFAADAQTRMVHKAATLWAGSYSLNVAVYDENGQPASGALVTTRLGDDKEVKATATTQNGGATFFNLPNWTVILEASASGNRLASVATNGGAGFAQLRLRGFNPPSDIDNDDFSLGTAGWEIGSAPVQIIPHVEGTFIPLEDPPAGQTSAGPQVALASLSDGERVASDGAASRAEAHARASARRPQAAAVALSDGGDGVSALAALEEEEEVNNDLQLATFGEGPQTISRTVAVEPGTQEVQVRYKFITTEVPGGYYGTQYNDYFNISIRTQAEGGSGSESQTMNGLGLSAFDVGGATDWREFKLPVSGNGDTVQIDATVANVADGLLDSYLVIDVVAKPKVTIGELTAVVRGQTATVNVKMSTNAPTTVTLTLQTTKGTGAARFDANNSTSLDITKTTDVVIKGVTESSARDNIRLLASGEDGKRIDDEDFCVLWVTLDFRTGGLMVSDDNDAKDTILSAVGTLKLDTVQSTGTSARFWRNTVEVVGAVSPSDFKGKIRIPRYRTEPSQYYINNTLDDTLTRPVGLDDAPGSDVFRDLEPKPNGRVYDFDAPGITFQGLGGSVGDTRRHRINFRQVATYEEKGQEKRDASDQLLWFTRLSIEKTATGEVLATDVPGDNMAARGTTKLTWNLQ